MKKWIFALIGVVAVVGWIFTQGTQHATGLQGSITAVGSSALQPLVEAAAEDFQKNYPEVMINVQGGGSGQGLSQIIAGTVEIGNSDVFAEDKKIDASKKSIKDNKVAVVGIAPIVNYQAGVISVTKQQLIDIFTGRIKNWREVGGNDLDIIVINRASSSGSRATFKKYALDGQEPMTAQEQDNSGTVKKLVKETSGAISYVSFSYLNDKDYQTLAIDGVVPNEETVTTNQWTVWAYEHMYTAIEQDNITKTFMAYMLSDTVQENIIPRLGYIPISKMKVERDARGNISEIKS